MPLALLNLGSDGLKALEHEGDSDLFQMAAGLLHAICELQQRQAAALIANRRDSAVLAKLQGRNASPPWSLTSDRGGNRVRVRACRAVPACPTKKAPQRISGEKTAGRQAPLHKDVVEMLGMVSPEEHGKCLSDHEVEPSNRPRSKSTSGRADDAEPCAQTIGAQYKLARRASDSRHSSTFPPPACFPPSFCEHSSNMPCSVPTSFCRPTLTCSRHVPVSVQFA